ncbi:MAG: trehalase family glycosidase [Melioribacteraceae bacterium]|nr:trehalase family glycosidase [Melioribacteraceae bacterium]
MHFKGFPKASLSLMVIIFCLMFVSCNCEQNNIESTNTFFPNIWSEKQIFAFSALDGQTNYNEPFTTVLLGSHLGIRLQNSGYINENLPIERLNEKHPLWFGFEVDGEYYENLPGKGNNSFDENSCKIVTSSIINTLLRKKNIVIELKMVFADRNTIVGSVLVSNQSTKDVILHVNNWSDSPCKIDNNSIILEKDNFKTTLSFKENFLYENYKAKASISAGIQKIFNFSYRIEYSTQSVKYIQYNFDSLFTKRLEPYIHNSLKGNQNERIKRTYLKAYSVLRANTESAIDRIKTMWTTPDRIPHRKMWLWDSGFHAMGIKYFDKEWAKNAIKAVLEYQMDDGFIPHIMEPDKHSNITQPPILAWSVWDVYQTIKDKEFLEYSLPRLKKFLDWIEKNRDKNNNGLFEWYNGDESGMDNSPRFDSDKVFDAIDFSCFVVNDYNYIEKIASEIGDREAAFLYASKRKTLTKNINENLWDSSRSFYYDKYFDGTFSDVKGISSFLPLFANVADKQKADIIISELKVETLWWTDLPLPSVSLQDETFGSNMWRGPVWINYSFFNYIGLLNYGYREMAFELLKRNIEAITKWYFQEGTIFEFYDPLDVTSPKLLPRKKTFGAIYEFGWSSSLYIRMVNELIEQQKL